MAAMFSAEDMRQLVKAFPFETCSGSDTPSSEGSHLIPSATDDGFVKRRPLIERIRDIMQDSTRRVSIEALATDFDSPLGALYDVVEKGKFILSGDGRAIVPIAELSTKRDKLSHQLARGTVSFDELAKSWDLALNSIPLAVEACNSSALRQTSSPLLCIRQLESPTDSFIYTDSFLKDLFKSAEMAFRAAHEKAEPLRFFCANMAYSLRSDIKNHIDRNLDGRCEMKDPNLFFIPTTYVDRQIKTKFEDVASARIKACSLQSFVDLAPERYPHADAVRDEIRSTHGERIFLLADYAASYIWWKGLVQSLLEQLTREGVAFVDLTSTSAFLSPAAIQEAGFRASQEVSSGAGNHGTVVCTDGLYPWILEQKRLDEIRANLANDAVKLAERAWETTTLSLEEISFPSHELKNSQTVSGHAMPGLPIDSILDNDNESIKTAFRTRLASLEAETATQFVALWHDRISLRLEIYTRGCRAITTDTKLQTQLTDVLKDYAVKDLIPETISRAQSRRLIRSAKLKKNITKLQEALQKPSSEQTLHSVIASLQKFAAKMEIPTPDDEAVAAKKGAYVADLVSGMQRDTDGPRLFLTCVVVLLARRLEGVVYATGKLAPKLLKIVKGDVGGETGERLERLKEAVKAGKVGEGEREELRRLAAEV